MKFLSEFRRKEQVEALLGQIKRRVRPNKTYTFMEVCGTHTVSIARNGLRHLLPKQIRLVSGPGCPVCVTPTSYIDEAIARSLREDVITTTFADMLRVPGTGSSLERSKAGGADIRTVFSALEPVSIAEKESNKRVVFLGIGFETTAPTVAAAIKAAKENSRSNFLVASAHKTMPVPMRILASDPHVPLQGYICPGHVCTITGPAPFKPLVEEFHIPAVIAGFEPSDILRAILALTEQVNRGEARLENLYRRSVREDGNPKAWSYVKEVFTASGSRWRGLGHLPESGLKIREKYAAHDADKALPVEVPQSRDPPLCRCGDVLKGIIYPEQCSIFGKTCTPETPVGPCMVSGEGACQAAYKAPASTRAP